MQVMPNVNQNLNVLSNFVKNFVKICSAFLDCLYVFIMKDITKLGAILRNFIANVWNEMQHQGYKVSPRPGRCTEASRKMEPKACGSSSEG